MLLLTSQLALADYPIEVIELKSRSLEEILPLVRPLIGADGTATGMGNNLVLKAAPGRVREAAAPGRAARTPPPGRAGSAPAPPAAPSPGAARCPARARITAR